MLKIKLGELKELLEGLNDILHKELPIKTSYWVSKASKKVAKEHALFEANRMKLLQKHGKKNEKGELLSENGVAILENYEDFAKEYSELVDTDIEMDIKTFTLDDFGDIKLLPKTMLVIEKIITEGA